MLLSEAIAKYTTSPEWLNLSYRSKRIYSNGFSSLEPLYDRHVKSLTRPDILNFRDTLYRMPGKCRVALMALNVVFRYLIDREHISANPALRINGLPPPKPIERWEETEVDKFLNTAHPYLEAAMLLALYTGQRLSDLVRMKWEDYDGDTIKISQKKTGHSFLLPVHPKLRDSLDARQIEAQDAPNDRPFVLWNRQGKPLTAGALANAVTRHARSLGIKKSIHGVRKTTASILAESGCSAHEIMAITGHKSLKEVQRYTLQASQLSMGRSAIKRWEDAGRQ